MIATNIARSNRNGYLAAMDLLPTMQRLHRSQDSLAAFDAYLARLRQEHCAKRTLVGRLDDSQVATTSIADENKMSLGSQRGDRILQRCSHRTDDEVGTSAVGDLPDGVYDVMGSTIHHMDGAEFNQPTASLRSTRDADDRGTGLRGKLDGGKAHAAGCRLDENSFSACESAAREKKRQ